MKQTLIITISNRMIIAGEYLAAYGHGISHIEALMGALQLPKSAEVGNVYTDGNVEVNITFPGNLSKRNQAELDLALANGMVLEAEYL